MTAEGVIAKLMVADPKLADLAKANYVLVPFHNKTGFLLGFIDCRPSSNRYVVLGIDQNKNVFDSEVKAMNALSELIDDDIWWHREDS